MTTDNRELVKLLDIVKRDKKPEDSQKMVEMIQDAIVFVPAVMPKDTDPALLKQMAQNYRGQALPIPAGARPQPCILTNNQGQKLFPVFTSQEEIAKGTNMPKFPITLNIPFHACTEMMTKLKDIEGAVINPYSHNIVMNLSRNAEPEGKKVKLTEQQFHALVRQQTEAQVLPKKLYAEKETFIKDLCEREGECMLELYGIPYSDSGKCPYTAEDFDVMSLYISDSFQLIRLTLPEKNLYPGTCPCIMITWNPQTEEAGYYAIVQGKKEEGCHLIQVFADNQRKDLGEAPDEGSELQYIIDLAQQ